MSRAVGHSELRFEVVVKPEGGAPIVLEPRGESGKELPTVLNELRDFVERATVLAEALQVQD